MARNAARPGWYDARGDSGFARQAYWDGDRWTGATRGLSRHFRRLLILVLVLVAIYGMNQVGETLETLGWEETDGIVESRRSWYDGFSSESGLVVAHEGGMAFLTSDESLDVGDRVTFYFDPDQRYFVEESREPNAFQDETSFPRVNATLSSPSSHTMRVFLSLAVAAGLVIAIVWLRRREWRVPEPTQASRERSVGGGRIPD